MARTRSRGGFWVGAVAEICIIVASLVYVVSSELWALIAWEALATGYLAIGSVSYTHLTLPTNREV